MSVNNANLYLSLIEQAKNITDLYKRRLFVIGILTKSLKNLNIKPVVVGGFALEFYTTGGYNTGDVDLVFPDSKVLDGSLTKWGFKKEGRHWINQELDIYIESPGSSLFPRENEHLVKVMVEGLPVYFIGLEDLIVDRLNAFVHWKSKDDGYWTKELLIIHRKRIDWKYLRQRIKEEGTVQQLDKLVKEIKNA